MLEILIIFFAILGGVYSWKAGKEEEKLFWEEQKSIEEWMKRQDSLDKKNKILWYSEIRKSYRNF